MTTKQLSALIADDVLASREVLNHMLERLAVDVLAQVADGEKARAQLPADIAVPDIDMPGQGGLEALTPINSLAKTPWTVIVSAHSTVGNFQKAVDRGAKGFVVKPYIMAKIQQQIDNCVLAQGRAPNGPKR